MTSQELELLKAVARDVVQPALQFVMLLAGAVLGLWISRSERTWISQEQEVKDLLGLFSELASNAVYCDRIQEDHKNPLRPLSASILEDVYSRCLSMKLVPEHTQMIFAYRTMLITLNNEIEVHSAYRKQPDEFMHAASQDMRVRASISEFRSAIQKTLVGLEKEIHKRDRKIQISVPPAPSMQNGDV